MRHYYFRKERASWFKSCLLWILIINWCLRIKPKCSRNWIRPYVSCVGWYSVLCWHLHPCVSINGSPIASANTFTGRSQQILCCCISEMNEWDTQNVIVTGHSDGVVRVMVFSLIYFLSFHSVSFKVSTDNGSWKMALSCSSGELSSSKSQKPLLQSL